MFTDNNQYNNDNFDSAINDLSLDNNYNETSLINNYGENSLANNYDENSLANNYSENSLANSFNNQYHNTNSTFNSSLTNYTNSNNNNNNNNTNNNNANKFISPISHTNYQQQTYYVDTSDPCFNNHYSVNNSAISYNNQYYNTNSTLNGSFTNNNNINNNSNQVYLPIPNTYYQPQCYSNSIDQSFDNNYNPYTNNSYNYQYYKNNSTPNHSTTNSFNNTNNNINNKNAQTLNINTPDNFIIESTSSSLENSSLFSLSPKQKTSRDDYSSNNTTKTRIATAHHQLPEEAVDRLNEWFESHLNHPYPTTEEKQRLAEECGITSKQVNSWFCNRRNRSQNTKPKRIKRQLEREISNVFNELAQNPHVTQKVIVKLRNTLMKNDIGIVNNNC